MSLTADQIGTRHDRPSHAFETGPKFTLCIGGSVGNDPYDSRTWSGSASHLTRALNQAEALNQAIGLTLPRWQDVVLKAKNFNPSRDSWRRRFYLDSAYREALTESAKKRLATSRLAPPFLQIGAMFSLPRATGYRVPCFSYHDGNIVEAVKSGYGFAGIPSRMIDKAIQYEGEVAQEMRCVFTFSEYLRNSFVHDFGLTENRVINVGAGVNVDDFPEPGPNKDYENHEILFVGVDFERKGGNELLAAFRIVRQTLTDARLHIVGPHRRPAGAHQAGITFHGNLSKGFRQQRDRLYRLYEQASVFVLPSKYEPFGLAPLEAMLFQVPCVVTNGWALREFVAPGINGALVDKGSVDSLAAALLRLLRSPQELSVMGKNARAMVLMNHTWPNVVAKMRTAASAWLCHSAL